MNSTLEGVVSFLEVFQVRLVVLLVSLAMPSTARIRRRFPTLGLAPEIPKILVFSFIDRPLCYFVHIFVLVLR